MADLIVIKVTLGDDNRRVNIPRSIPFSELIGVFAQLFDVPQGTIRLSYRDEDDDDITVGSELELRQILASTAPRFYVTLRSAASDSNIPSETTASLPTPPASSTARPPSTSDASSPAGTSQAAPSSSGASTTDSANSAPPPPLPSFEGLMGQFGGFMEEAQRVLLANPQLSEQAKDIANQFSNFLGHVATQSPPASFAGCNGGGAFAWPGSFPGPFCSGPAGSFPGSFPREQHQQADPGYDEDAKLKALAAMGFVDENRNRELLRKELGNVHRVVEQLIAQF